MRNWARLAVVGLCCAAPAAFGDSIFSFASVSAGQALPFSLSVNGLTASFEGSGAVCVPMSVSGSMFVTLTGNALMQGFCQQNGSGPLTINFSGVVAQVAFPVAVNGTAPVPVTVTYKLNGTTVGTQTVQPVVPNGSLSPEAAVSYTGAFNSITISSTGLLAVGNVDAVTGPQGTR